MWSSVANDMTLPTKLKVGNELSPGSTKVRQHEQNHPDQCARKYNVRKGSTDCEGCYKLNTTAWAWLRSKYWMNQFLIKVLHFRCSLRTPIQRGIIFKPTHRFINLLCKNSNYSRVLKRQQIAEHDPSPILPIYLLDFTSSCTHRTRLHISS